MSIRKKGFDVSLKNELPQFSHLSHACSLPRVAILLASYNGGNWIEEQLSSIQMCQGVTVHVIVSDDGSTDATLDILKRQNLTILTILNQAPRGGAGQNFFRLITDATWDDFDYVAFSDQDDIWNTNKLLRAVEQIVSKNLDGYSSDVTAFWPNGKRSYIKKSQPQRQFDYLFESGGPGNTFVLTKKSAERLRKFIISSNPELIAQVTLHDWLIYAFFRSVGARWEIDQVSGLDYRQHHNNVLGSSSGISALRRRFKMIANNWYTGQVLVLADLISAKHPVLDFIANPTKAQLYSVLVDFRQYRRKFSECVLLGACFIYLCFRKK